MHAWLSPAMGPKLGRLRVCFEMESTLALTLEIGNHTTAEMQGQQKNAHRQDCLTTTCHRKFLNPKKNSGYSITVRNVGEEGLGVVNSLL